MEIAVHHHRRAGAQNGIEHSVERGQEGIAGRDGRRLNPDGRPIPVEEKLGLGAEKPKIIGRNGDGGGVRMALQRHQRIHRLGIKLGRVRARVQQVRERGIAEIFDQRKALLEINRRDRRRR